MVHLFCFPATQVLSACLPALCNACVNLHLYYVWVYETKCTFWEVKGNYIAAYVHAHNGVDEINIVSGCEPTLVILILGTLLTKFKPILFLQKVKMDKTQISEIYEVFSDLQFLQDILYEHAQYKIINYNYFKRNFTIENKRKHENVLRTMMAMHSVCALQKQARLNH